MLQRRLYVALHGVAIKVWWPNQSIERLTVWKMSDALLSCENQFFGQSGFLGFRFPWFANFLKWLFSRERACVRFMSFLSLCPRAHSHLMTRPKSIRASFDRAKHLLQKLSLQAKRARYQQFIPEQDPRNTIQSERSLWFSPSDMKEYQHDILKAIL